MAKKLISVWLSLTLLLLFSPTSIYANDSAKGQFLNRNIDINGVRVYNYYLEDSFCVYQNTTYFPLNEEMEDILGFTAEMNWESRTLKILKKDPIRTKPANTTLKNNLQNIDAKVLKDIRVMALTEAEQKEPVPLVAEVPDTLRGANFKANLLDIAGQIEEYNDDQEKDWISMPDLIVQYLDLSGTPILQAGDVLYLPVRAFAGSNFGWDVYYDEYSGVYISTDPQISAAATFDKAESDYNRGLVNFIRAKNGSISEGLALQMVFLFKHEAKINNLDEKLLMAIALKESTYYPTIVAAGGSVGLMQVMPSTAKAYGVNPSQLYDMHTNVEFGSWYIGREMKNFSDTTKALSAYNQGSGAVSRGSYNTRYATRVLNGKQEIESFLTQNGYGTGQ